MWRLASSAAVRAGGAAAAVSLGAFAFGRSPVQAEPTVDKRFAAAFLNSDAVTALHRLVQPKFKDVAEKPHMTISYEPRGAKLAELSSQLGRPVDLVVKAIVSDEYAQAVVVEVVKATEDDDGGVPYFVDNSIPHVVVSVSNSHDGYGPFYGNHLLARAKAAAGSLDKNWEGVLPARDGYEKTKCRIEIPAEKTLLPATLCTSDHWQIEANRCGQEKECGFCRFMKLGPCGKEFAIWEECIEKCKETEEDFIDKCGSQTLALKECVDQNPDYYYSVIDDKNGNEETEENESGPSEDTSLANTTENAQSESDVQSASGEEQLITKLDNDAQGEKVSLIEINPQATIQIDAAPEPAATGSAAEEEDEFPDNWTTKG